MASNETPTTSCIFGLLDPCMSPVTLGWWVVPSGLVGGEQAAYGTGNYNCFVITHLKKSHSAQIITLCAAMGTPYGNPLHEIETRRKSLWSLRLDVKGRPETTISFHKTVYNVTSQAYTFLNLIDQQFAFFWKTKKRPMKFDVRIVRIQYWYNNRQIRRPDRRWFLACFCLDFIPIAGAGLAQGMLGAALAQQFSWVRRPRSRTTFGGRDDCLWLLPTLPIAFCHF